MDFDFLVFPSPPPSYQYSNFANNLMFIPKLDSESIKEL